MARGLSFVLRKVPKDTAFASLKQRQNACVCSCNLQVFLFCMDVVHSYDAIALSIHGQASQESHIQIFWLETAAGKKRHAKQIIPIA